MKFLFWEPPIDFQSFDQLDHVKCGSSTDITLGISEVEDAVDIIGYDHNNNALWTINNYITKDVSGLCKVTGSLVNEWASPRSFERIDLYSDNLENNKPIWTNSQGDYIFTGTPGQRFKLKIQKDWNYYWFMIPDKTTITFEELMNSYGYTHS